MPITFPDGLVVSVSGFRGVVGTAVTPDLKVVWTLPDQLEFVSGVGSRGCQVTGSGQAAAVTPGPASLVVAKAATQPSAAVISHRASVFQPSVSAAAPGRTRHCL